MACGPVCYTLPMELTPQEYSRLPGATCKPVKEANGLKWLISAYGKTNDIWEKKRTFFQKKHCVCKTNLFDRQENWNRSGGTQTGSVTVSEKELGYNAAHKHLNLLLDLDLNKRGHNTPVITCEQPEAQRFQTDDPSCHAVSEIQNDESTSSFCWKTGPLKASRGQSSVVRASKASRRCRARLYWAWFSGSISTRRPTSLLVWHRGTEGHRRSLGSCSTHTHTHTSHNDWVTFIF